MCLQAGDPLRHTAQPQHPGKSSTPLLLQLSRVISCMFVLLLQGRRLQQSNSTCPLILGSSTLEFAACKSLEPVVSSDYNLLYTVTTPTGQPGPVLHGAIDAASTGPVRHCLTRKLPKSAQDLLIKRRLVKVLQGF